MPDAIPTMTPAEEAAWAARLQAEGVFPSQRPGFTRAGQVVIATAYTLIPMLCQQCGALFVWHPEHQRAHWRRALRVGRIGPPTCGARCARAQATRSQMRGYTTAAYPPLHVIADRAYAATHAN